MAHRLGFGAVRNPPVRQRCLRWAGRCRARSRTASNVKVLVGGGANLDVMVRPDDLYTQVRLIDDVGFARAGSVGVLVDCDDVRAIVEFA